MFFFAFFSLFFFRMRDGNFHKSSRQPIFTNTHTHTRVDKIQNCTIIFSGPLILKIHFTPAMRRSPIDNRILPKKSESEYEKNKKFEDEAKKIKGELKFNFNFIHSKQKEQRRRRCLIEGAQRKTFPYHFPIFPKISLPSVSILCHGIIYTGCDFSVECSADVSRFIARFFLAKMAIMFFEFSRNLSFTIKK